MSKGCLIALLIVLGLIAEQKHGFEGRAFPLEARFVRRSEDALELVQIRHRLVVCFA